MHFIHGKNDLEIYTHPQVCCIINNYIKIIIRIDIKSAALKMELPNTIEFSKYRSPFSVFIDKGCVTIELEIVEMRDLYEAREILIWGNPPIFSAI